MKTYRVELNRSYIVTILAENVENAKNHVEFYYSDPSDISGESDRVREKFKILDIENTYNEAMYAEEI